jgi:hypothetical protein
MGVPISEVGYTSVTTGRGDHEVHKGHVMVLEEIFIEIKIVSLVRIIIGSPTYNLQVTG